MKEFFSKLWVKITAICLAVILFLFSILLLLNSTAIYNPKPYHVFGLSGIFGSFNKKGNPKTYYQTEKTSNIIELMHIRPNNSEVYYVWINVSDMQEDSVIYLYNGEDSSKVSNLTLLGEYYLSGEELKKDSDGWICIYDRNNSPINYLTVHFYIGTKTKMRIREVLVFDNIEASGPIAYDVKGIVRRSNPTSKTDSLYENFDYSTLVSSSSYTSTFTPAVQEKLKNLTKLNDEHDTFDKKSVK